MRSFFILLVIAFIPLLAKSQSTHNYKNLVLEGAGVRGLAYAGAFRVLEDSAILPEIEKIAGTSSGAIAGLLISIGYSAAEMKSIMEYLPVQEFNDGNWGLPGKYFRFKKTFGIYKGYKFENWLSKKIESKTGNPCFTFNDLHQLHLTNKSYKDLYITGTNLSKQRLEIFSWENTPDMPLALAVRISSGVPLYFEPVVLNENMCRIRKKDSTTFRNYYVDGGLLSNYPISLFDSCKTAKNTGALCNDAIFNPKTIGIKLERGAQIDSFGQGNINMSPFKIKDLSGYVNAFANMMIESLARHYPGLKNEEGRTIYIDQGNVSPRVKKTKQQDKLLLYNNGMLGAVKFLNDHR